tara:strand:+ start:793 stop:1275 length:483 start_codon:yes stop_codon:yes gene_type:complete
MNKFIIASFLMLGWGFYEMSGGADFVPEVRPIAQVAITTQALDPVPFDAPVVTRAASIDLPSFPDPAQAEVITASLVTTPIVQDVPAVQQAPVAAIDLRQVSGVRVNMRAGPGTSYSVLDTLARGTKAEVIEVTADGWARIRVTSTDQIGWMAARLLSGS